jgi:hypothetical protein
MASEREGVARARYDFARQGGAVGDIPLAGDTIPKGAVILDSLVKVETGLTSAAGTATVALRAESGHDLQEAKKVEEAPWSTTGPKRGAVTATSTPIATTARRQVVATIATQAVTKGKFSVYVRYLLPNA